MAADPRDAAAAPIPEIDTVGIGRLVTLLASALRSAHTSTGIPMDEILSLWARQAPFLDVEAFLAIIAAVKPEEVEVNAR